MIILICHRKIGTHKKWILGLFLLAYCLHFILVEKHIYAMAHANVSYGFFCRYSYFYIPLFVVSLPVLIIELGATLLSKFKTGWYIMASSAIAIIAILSFTVTMQNWHKSYGDIYAKIWEENSGYNAVTYAVGGRMPKMKPYIIFRMRLDMMRHGYKKSTLQQSRKLFRMHFGSGVQIGEGQKRTR